MGVADPYAWFKPEERRAAALAELAEMDGEMPS